MRNKLFLLNFRKLEKLLQIEVQKNLYNLCTNVD